jgi:predicted Fe-Mo cluster-binding NifX family protein
MLIAAASDGSDLGTNLSAFYASASTMVFVETNTMKVRAERNPASSLPGSAYKATALLLAGMGVRALAVGSIDARWLAAFEKVDVPVYPVGCMTVMQAIRTIEGGRARPARTAGE